MRVLIVDDDEASRYLISSILTASGHDVDAAVDGVEGLAKARSHRPDVVISDILMPRMDGYQLVREWKADEDLASVPIVFYTASYTDPADEKFALDLGVDGFLNKPVEPAVLLQTIADVVSYEQRIEPRSPLIDDETEVLREYNERLVHKLEDKVIDLERSNTMLEGAMSALSEEMEANKTLVKDLKVEVAERRQREEELRRERDFTARIIETADVFIVGLDRDLRTILFSPGAVRMSGHRAEDVVGMPFIDMFVPEEDRAFALKYVRDVQQGDGSVGRVGPIRVANGEVRVLEWSATPSSDAGESAEGILLFGIDVTERVTTAAIDRAMARIDLAVLLDRPRSEILDVACERLVSEFGYALAFVVLRDDEYGLEIQSVAGPLASLIIESGDVGAAIDVCPVREAMDRDSVTIRSAADFEIAGIDPRWRSSEVAAIPLRAHGVTMGALGLVSSGPYAFGANRKESLRRLSNRLAVGLLVVEGREQVALQSAALESAGNAIVIATVAGKVSWVNRAFSSLTGHTAFDAVGADLFAEDSGYREPLYADAWASVQAGKSWRGEFTNVRKDGTPYQEDVTLAPVFDEEGEVRHAVIVKQDVSERHELEQLKSDFVAVVSHELRTPLTSIIGYADLIAAAYPRGETPDTVVAALSKLQLNAGKMRNLIEQLLEVVQVRSELLALDIGECDVGTLVTVAVERAPFTSLHTPHIDLEPDLPSVRCDATRLMRVLELLLDNAIKYSPDGGTVRIGVAAARDAVTVAIADEGVGMPPDRIPGLFEHFTQLDMSSTRRFGGMGLGLFLAYSIVRAHGGSITATSEEGVGSTFKVRVPVSGPGS